MSVAYPSSKTFTASSTRPGSPTLPASMTWRDFILNPSVACWGDSLTAGTGASVPYPSALGSVCLPTGRTVIQGGVGGETSGQVLTRFLAGNLNDIAVIWVGRNDFSLGNPTQDIKDNIAAMIAAMTSNPKQYVALSVHNRSTEPAGDASTGDAIIAFNDELEALYPDNYLDTREYLMTQGDGSSTDNDDIANGVVPSSLRVDNIHLNDAGCQKVAEHVAQFIKDNGW